MTTNTDISNEYDCDSEEDDNETESTDPEGEEDHISKLEATLSSISKAPESALSPDAQAIMEALNLSPSNKELSKPDISRFPDAIDNGRLTIEAGDKITIERRANFLAGNPYLDTRTYTIKKIDHSSGILSLWDDEMQQWAMDNYKTGPSVGQIYKIPLGRLPPPSSSSRKRGRPRKFNPQPAPQHPTDDTQLTKKKRGRPKGSKNGSTIKNS